MKIDLILNGIPCHAEVEANESLLDFLRKRGLASVKRGCDSVCCGVCTVWLDDKPVLSCACLAVRAAGHSVTTLEGVSQEADALRECLAGQGAEQCGFCSPGLMMTVLAMERENPDISTEDEINSYLGGNLCRCTGYAAQTRAIMRYLENKH